MSEWFYNNAGTQLGPLSWDDLQHTAAAGQLEPQGYVWTEGMEQWVRAEDLPDPFTQIPTARVALPAEAAPVVLDYGHASAVRQAVGAPIQAGFWLRVGAYFIDWIILSLVGGAVSMAMALVNEQGFAWRFGPSIGFHWDMASTLNWLLAWAYFSVQESSRYQATLGKRACGIWVMSSTGRRLSFAHATGRHFAKILSDLILGIGYLMAGLTRDKQALHDLVAGTMVIRGVRRPYSVSSYAENLAGMSGRG